MAFAGLDIEGVVKTVGIRSITVIGADGATTFILIEILLPSKTTHTKKELLTLMCQ